MKVPLLDLRAQYAPLRDAIRTALDEVCDAQAFILGPVVSDFESEVAAYCGIPHAIGMSSGTDALLAALMALDVGPGDAVITSPYSFFATAGVVARLGATPVFVDVDPATWNLAPDAVAACLASWRQRHPGLRPRVLLPVHLFGQCADMAPLLALAAQHDLRVVEDAAQAIGAEYRFPDGRIARAGTMGDIGCFSFFPSKNLGGFGDGGLVVTPDPALAERLRILRVHGGHPKYVHHIIGGNFRLDALQAAVLRVKLPRLDAWHAGRRRNATRYGAAFAGSAVCAPTEAQAAGSIRFPHIYNQYVVRVPERDRVREALQERGIGCEVYYPIPLHRQACFAALGYGEGSLPVSEQAARETLALPVYPELPPGAQEYVIETLRGLV